MKELNEKKNKIKKIDDVKNLPFKNGEEIRNYCQDKNISITSEDYFKYFREEVSINDKLMMSFVKENLSYLKYDKSNNPEIYKYFLYQQIKEFEDIKETLPNEFHQEVWQHETFRLPFYKELIKLLDDNSVGVDFKNHITEWIRSKCDYFVSFKEMNSLYNKDLEKYYMYLSSHNLPLSLDIEKIISLYQSDYGQELEKIYKNDDYIIGMHGTNYITENVEDNDFF